MFNNFLNGGENMTFKILVVEDEVPISDILKFTLEKEGYKVFTVYDGVNAIGEAKQVEPDLILLDIMLPGMNGYEVCKELRTFTDQPIIMLTAKDSENDKVYGLEVGADDYVTKPFSTRELLARVKANLRRINDANASITAVIQVGELYINPSSYIVKKNESNIELTHREFEVLHYLARHVGQVLTREHLLQYVWGYDYLGDIRTVDVTMRRLREKIEDNPSEPTYITTRRGLGYVMRNPAKGEYGF